MEAKKTDNLMAVLTRTNLLDEADEVARELVWTTLYYVRTEIEKCMRGGSSPEDLLERIRAMAEDIRQGSQH